MLSAIEKDKLKILIESKSGDADYSKSLGASDDFARNEIVTLSPGIIESTQNIIDQLTNLIMASNAELEKRQNRLATLQA